MECREFRGGRGGLRNGIEFGHDYSVALAEDGTCTCSSMAEATSGGRPVGSGLGDGLFHPIHILLRLIPRW